MEKTIDLEFRELQSRVKAAGLFERSDGFYLCQAAMILTLYAMGFWLIVTGENFLLGVLASAVILAFADGQGGFLIHDIAHGAVLNTDWHVRWHLLVYDLISFVFGISLEGWQRKHNDHHNRPNDPEEDPDFVSHFLAFSPEQAEVKRSICRFITRYQHLLFPFMFLFLGIQIRIVAGTYAWKRGTTRTRINLLLIVLHIAVYLWVLLSFRGLWEAVAVIALNYGLLGLYFGVAFSVNHFGMPTLTPGKSLSRLQTQVPTARNISGGWLTTFLLGGLNCQIEHHLFSAIPHSNLLTAARIVSKFCKERGVAYHCVSFRKAYAEVYVHLREMARYAA